MVTYELELCHHGILGQKWGKKNGPPYPLNFDDLSEKERAEAKQKSIDDGDVQTAAANKKHYTSQELRTLMDRFDVNQKINSLAAADIAKGQNKTRELCEKLNTLTEVGNKVANGIEAGSKVYNAVAKVANALGDKDLPIIGEKKNKGTRSVNREFEDGQLIKVTSSVTKDGVTTSTTKNFQKKKKGKAITSFTDQDDINRIMSRIGDYSDDEISKMASRAKNINKIKNVYKNNDKDDD